MLLFAAPDWPIGPAAPFILLLALALDALIGDPRWLPHPVRLMGWLTGLLDRALNRERHGDAARVILGGVAVVLVVGASAAAGWGRHPLRGRARLGLARRARAGRGAARAAQHGGSHGAGGARPRCRRGAGAGCGAPHRRPRPPRSRRARHRPRSHRERRRELFGRRGGAGVLVPAARPAGALRLQGDQHHGQHDRPPLAPPSRLRPGGGAPRRCGELGAGADRGRSGCAGRARRTRCRTGQGAAHHAA